MLYRQSQHPSPEHHLRTGANHAAGARGLAGGRELSAKAVRVREALVRTNIGEVSLGEQRPGSLRALTRKEIGSLYQAVGM